ncbi:MAG: nickel-dependent hydrogenase large subunit [Betaproteobacteria bacterium]|nr:nickel-dependent hydrogenase large subunit [Betaproteobacteria bacterium]
METARGTLLHQVTLAGDHVAHYRIVAPTEWNFHPRGAFRARPAGLPGEERDGGARRRRPAGACAGSLRGLRSERGACMK